MSTITATHDVFNQSPVFEDVNLFATDPVLRDVARGLAPARVADLSSFGAICGSAAAFELAQIGRAHV